MKFIHYDVSSPQGSQSPRVWAPFHSSFTFNLSFLCLGLVCNVVRFDFCDENWEKVALKYFRGDQDEWFSVLMLLFGPPPPPKAISSAAEQRFRWGIVWEGRLDVWTHELEWIHHTLNPIPLCMGMLGLLANQFTIYASLNTRTPIPGRKNNKFFDFGPACFKPMQKFCS